jgi:hypothetical protein
MNNTQTDWAKLARRDDNEIDYSDTPNLPIDAQTLRIRKANGRIIPINDTMVAIHEKIFIESE